MVPLVRLVAEHFGIPAPTVVLVVTKRQLSKIIESGWAKHAKPRLKNIAGQDQWLNSTW